MVGFDHTEPIGIWVYVWVYASIPPADLWQPLRVSPSRARIEGFSLDLFTLYVL